MQQAPKATRFVLTRASAQTIAQNTPLSAPLIAALGVKAYNRL